MQETHEIVRIIRNLNPLIFVHFLDKQQNFHPKSELHKIKVPKVSQCVYVSSRKSIANRNSGVLYEHLDTQDMQATTTWWGQCYEERANTSRAFYMKVGATKSLCPLARAMSTMGAQKIDLFHGSVA